MSDTTTAEDILYFDAFTEIGPRRHKHPAHPWRLDELRAEMDHCSISGALVSYTQSVNYDPQFGNRELSRMLEPHNHLFPVWNVMPAHTGEFPGARELRREMDGNGIAAVALHPRTNAWDWDRDYSRDLLEMLGDTETLVILRRTEFDDLDELDRFLERFPRLPVLLTGAVWTEQRRVIPLVRRHRQLHLSFERFQIHYGPEFFHREGLGERMVFASHAPDMSAGAHRCYFDYAALPVGAKRAAAGGNLVRLLKGLCPPENRVNADEDDLMAAARHGRPLPTLLIDMHMHILHEGMNGAGEAYRMENGGPGGVFPLLKRLGCDGGGFMSWNGTVSGDSLAGNHCTRDALDVAPPGYWGLATFDPTHYRREELARMIPEVYGDPRFIGMKPYVRYGVEYHHASYDLWWEYGERRRFYALLHRVRADFREVETLARKYPGVRWVVAHCGKDYATADMAIETIRRFSNVYAEITLTPVPMGIIDYLVDHAGEDRVLYGSDLPMRDPRQQLGWVVFSGMSPAAKKKVLGGNALDVIAPNLESLPARNRPQREPRTG